jgi:uncharacterized membrane protein
MIQCHTFNSLARADLRNGGPYVLSQFIGGMAAPLFLFMAGMTTGFQMESLDRREPRALARWLVALRRAGYILAVAFLFRFTNWVGSLPKASLRELLKVDILNGMGLALAVLAAVAMSRGVSRTRDALAAGLAIAALSPVVAALPWTRMPWLLQAYLSPGFGAGYFPFFPCAAYVAFGISAGTVVKRTTPEDLDRLMQWSVLVGLSATFAAWYFANIPFSIYPNSHFWTDSPALILIRTGVILAMGAGSYLWTAYLAGEGFSWMECLGRNSLMVYWVHVVLVYGNLVKPWKQGLSIPECTAVTLSVGGLMLLLSVAWRGWKRRRAAHRVSATAVTS